MKVEQKDRVHPVHSFINNSPFVTDIYVVYIVNISNRVHTMLSLREFYARG